MTEEAREVFRQQCLRSLASIMIQLNTVTDITQAGSPQYDQIGNPTSIGSFRIPNPVSYHHFYMAQTANSTAAGHYEEYCEIEPSDNERAYLLSMLDRHTPGRSQFERGADRVLRLLIDWGTTEDGNHESVLTHPDLDLQNILVDESGNITGLVDWDGVTMIPRSMGCSFPKWISRNWDPDCYRWRRNYASNASCQIDHSPEKMEYYRSMYVQYVEEVLLEAATAEQHFTDYSDVLRQSILFEALRRAVTRPQSSYFIVRQICNLIGHLTSQASFKTTYPDWKELAEEVVINSNVADLSKDSNLTRVVSLTDDSASTTHSDSDSSSDGSKVSYSTCLTSECASIQDPHLIELGTAALVELTEVSGAVQLPKLASIQEASREGIIIVEEATNVHRSLTPESDGSGSQKFPGQRKSSTSPRNLRAVFKILRSACGKQKKKSLDRSSDSSGLSSVVMDVTVSKVGDEQASSSAIVATAQKDNTVQAAESKDQSIDSVAIQTSMNEIEAGTAAGDMHSANESKQIDCGPDHSEILGIEINVTNRPLEQDVSNMDQNAVLLSKTSQEGPSVPSESDGSLDSRDPLVRRKGKAGLARRMVDKLATTCEPEHVDEVVVPCQEVKKDHLRNTGSSRTKRMIKRWVKDPFHKFHNSSTSSTTNKPSTSSISTSGSPVSSIPPHISDISSISGLGDPFQKSENGNEASSGVPEPKKGPPGQYHITPSGAKAWDLQNLEPLDEELLENEQFMTHQIFKALADGTLDEARMQRLKAGFFALLDSL